MTFKNVSLVALLLAGATWLGTSLVAAPRPAADVPLVISFGHPGTDALTSDGFTAPGYAADYANGLENVLAVIQASGNLRYSTQNDARKAVQRRMCVDFGDQFASQSVAVPFVDGNPRQCVNVLQPMHAYPIGDISIASLRYGQSVEKLTRFAWDDGGYRYRIGYGTDMNMDGIADSPSVRATCIAPQSSAVACTGWVLAPSTDGSAALFRFKLSKGQEGPAEFVANVTMPFAQTFTRE